MFYNTRQEREGGQCVVTQAKNQGGNLDLRQRQRLLRQQQTVVKGASSKGVPVTADGANGTFGF